MSKTDALLIVMLGMLVGWLLTMRRQRWHDEYITRKRKDHDDYGKAG